MSQAVRLKPETGEAPVNGAVRRVLVVDDSRAHLKLMAKILGRWGYEVREAQSGPEALAILAAEPIDLVLSDWVMPGMSGIELCRSFRDRAQDRYVYFILLTSKSAGEDVVTGLAAGADDFLSKPIDSDELRARIAAGERLVAMERAVREKNALLAEALAELQTVYDGVARDLVEAQRLQQSLVPDRHRSYLGADVSLLLRPCGHVGGDLVGAFRVTDTRIGIYAIDVSGHGIASALMTARLASYLTGSSPDHNVALTIDELGLYTMRPVDEVCARLNRLLIEDMETELYFTMAIADCNLRTGEVRLAQAGHPHPLVQRADGTVEFVGDGGMPIGLLDVANFSTVEFVLQPGDRLVMHSDGFTETTAVDGTMLGDEGLARLVQRHRALSGGDFFEALVWSLSDFASDRDFGDDLSGVLFEFRGLPGS